MAKPIKPPTPARLRVLRMGDQLWAHFGGQTWMLPANRSVAAKSTTKTATTTDGLLRAPMPASIVLLKCQVGDSVKRGATLCVLEAMKMEYHLHAPFDGQVKRLWHQAGDKVTLGEPLIEVQA